MRGLCFTDRSRSTEKTTPEVFCNLFQELARVRRGLFFANATPQALEPGPCRRPISARFRSRTRRARFCENVPLGRDDPSGGKVFSATPHDIPFPTGCKTRLRCSSVRSDSVGPATAGSSLWDLGPGSSVFPQYRGYRQQERHIERLDRTEPKISTALTAFAEIDLDPLFAQPE